MVWRIFNRFFYLQFLHVMTFAYAICYADQRKPLKYNFMPTGVLGTLLGLAPAFVMVLGLILLRFGTETIRSIWIYGIYGFIKGQDVLDLSTYSFHPSNLTLVQRGLGILGRGMFIPCFFISLVFSALREFVLFTYKNAMDSMLFFLNLALHDLDDVQALMSDGIPGKRNLFGILGYSLGVVTGVGVTFLIVILRFIYESIPGFWQGFKSEKVSNSTSSLQDMLRTPAYICGYLLMANIKVWMLVQTQVMQWHFQEIKLSNLGLTKIQLVSGLFGLMLGLVVMPFSWIAGFLLKSCQQSYLSFQYMLQKTLQQNRTIVNKNPFDRYVYGATGILLGGIASLALIIASICFISLFKWSNMLIYPRFSRQEQGLQQIKNLFSALNNLSSSFPAPEIAPPQNTTGGKGSYSFIGKVLRLNTPSVAEIYLDEVLRAARSESLDLAVIYNHLSSRFTGATLQQQELDNAHNYVSKYLN